VPRSALITSVMDGYNVTIFAYGQVRYAHIPPPSFEGDSLSTIDHRAPLGTQKHCGVPCVTGRLNE